MITPKTASVPIPVFSGCRGRGPGQLARAVVNLDPGESFWTHQRAPYARRTLTASDSWFRRTFPDRQLVIAAEFGGTRVWRKA